jgi:hypothetical protein
VVTGTIRIDPLSAFHGRAFSTTAIRSNVRVVKGRARFQMGSIVVRTTYSNIPHCVKKNTLCRNIIILLASHMFSRGPLKIQPRKVSSLIDSLLLPLKVLDSYVAVTPTIDGSLRGISAYVCFSRYQSTKESESTHLSGSHTYKRSKRSCLKDLRVSQP